VVNNSTSADTTCIIQKVKASGSVTTLLANGATVPAAGAYNALPFGQKINLMTGDLIKVTCVAACDVSLGGVEFT
jgi:hypothetical protein